MARYWDNMGWDGVNPGYCGEVGPAKEWGSFLALWCMAARGYLILGVFLNLSAAWQLDELCCSLPKLGSNAMCLKLDECPAGSQ